MFELITLGEVKPDFVSTRIQRFEGANYSHVAILVDGYLVYHAIGKGVSRTTINDLLQDGLCVIRRRISIEVRSKCCAHTWLEAMLGTKYSLAQYLGFIFPVLRFLPFVNNGRREVVCSEFAAQFVGSQSTKGYLALQKYTDCDFVGPKLCADVAAELFGEIQVDDGD